MKIIEDVIFNRNEEAVGNKILRNRKIDTEIN